MHAANAVILLVVTALPCAAQSSSAPFVAGFDRFFQEASAEGATLGGRLLLTELNCTACHATQNALLAPKHGPILKAAGERLQADWIKRFLASPHAVKPGTTMPDVLAGLPQADKVQAIDAIAAFLASQRAAFPELVSTASYPIAPQFWNKGDAERGRTLYHQVGCVACHEPDAEFETGRPDMSEQNKLLSQLEPEELKELGLLNRVQPVRSVPHADLSAKYTLKSLSYFLVDPAHARPGGRMPSLKLMPHEAADIAAWLLQGKAGRASEKPTDKALVAQGRALFVEFRCANCHEAEGVQPQASAKPMASIDPQAASGCLAPLPEKLPRYHLNDAQTTAIQRALVELQAATESIPLRPAEHAEFLMLQLNCYGCHERGARGGVGPNRWQYFETAGHVDIGDEGSIPPPLDGVGRKLKPSWLKKVLDGTGDVRPHMLARMPKFAPQTLADLPQALRQADALQPPAGIGQFGKLTDEMAEAGRTLFNFGCVQCHPVRSEALPGVVGVDVARMAERIEPDWFHEFLLNPIALKPRTRMPTFFPNGKSANQDLLNGDVDRQIAALWIYLNDAEQRALPQKLIDGKAYDFTLVPNDRPIVLRTFMKAAGTHAIAVGFPAQVHLAFDAEQVRVVEFWRGAFLDAHGTWFDRFAPPAEPLGTDVIALPPGIPLARLADKTQSWPKGDATQLGYQFRGYRLDKSGVPTFLYRFESFDIEDRFEPSSPNGMQRRIRVSPRNGPEVSTAKEPSHGSSAHTTLWFRANTGMQLTADGPNAYRNAAGLTVRLENWNGSEKPRVVGGQHEWIVPVTIEDESRIEVIYQW